MDKLGEHNIVADFLSRLEQIEDQDMVDDVFLDEHIFFVSTKTPWFSDMANYLATRKFPQHFSYQEKTKIIRQSANCSWI